MVEVHKKKSNEKSFFFFISFMRNCSVDMILMKKILSYVIPWVLLQNAGGSCLPMLSALSATTKQRQSVMRSCDGLTLCTKCIFTQTHNAKGLEMTEKDWFDGY